MSAASEGGAWPRSPFTVCGLEKGARVSAEKEEK